MTDVQYRVFFDNISATRDELDKIQEVVVEQEVDMAWEGRLRMLIFADGAGRWTGEDEDFLRPFSRVRVEVKVGENGFVPLIDGPVVGSDTNMSSEPGQSSITLIVHDDSAHLNREDNLEQFEGTTVGEVIQKLFSHDSISSIDISGIDSSLDVPVIQRGTRIHLLRELARRYGMHAYILPGTEPGQSIGCFKGFPTQTDGLDPLILVGEKRNILTFSLTDDGSRPSTFTASILNTADKAVITRTSSFRDSELLGEEQGYTGVGNEAMQVLRTQGDLNSDIDQMVEGQAAESGYSISATGSLNTCYHNVLQPYRVIAVIGVNGRNSGNYVITQVTHTLAESFYSQSFSLIRNARSGGSLNSLGDAIGGTIF